MWLSEPHFSEKDGKGAIFPTKNLLPEQIFCGKDGVFRPAGGDIRHQTRDRMIHGSIGRFAVFAHFVLFVVRTPTA